MKNGSFPTGLLLKLEYDIMIIATKQTLKMEAKHIKQPENIIKEEIKQVI